MIKRTPEGLEWSIDRKINYDLRNWPEHKKKRRAKQHGAFSLEKNKEVQHEQIGNSSAKTQFNRQT